jgi:Brp/Blh family beta-carotene 15,15'-monooxygenase
MVDIRNRHIYAIVICITLLFGALGLYQPAFLQTIQYPLLAILVLCIGVPHGATDFLLFKHLRGMHLSTFQVIRFFSLYLIVVFTYLLGWVWLPAPALVFFLLVSTYHFGQSNLEYMQFPRYLGYVSFLLWGSFALGGALLWHWDESSVIINQIVGFKVSWADGFLHQIQWFLLIINVLWLGFLALAGYINRLNLLREWMKLGVLSFMLFYTPLFVGFTLYFTLWHSLGSLLDQLDFFRRKLPSFTLAHYYRQAAPFTLLAVFGLMGLVWAQSFMFADVSLISLFFILIACMSLPHIFLVEESLKR